MDANRMDANRIFENKLTLAVFYCGGFLLGIIGFLANQDSTSSPLAKNTGTDGTSTGACF